MEEDTSEKVLFDLDLMDISDLRLMARQNNVSTDGDRHALLSRIRESFGFDFDDQIEVAVSSVSDSRSAKTKRLAEGPEQPAKKAKKVPSSSTVTSATTRTSSAEVRPGSDGVSGNYVSKFFNN